INAAIENWTLNAKQSRAFRIIAEHLLKPSGKPLHMFLGGPGGTGKLHVISALHDFF
ncbi:uncharacterized protein EV420DRAFT_1239330, partial [Desarmillaria tabescens]